MVRKKQAAAPSPVGAPSNTASKARVGGHDPFGDERSRSSEAMREEDGAAKIIPHLQEIIDDIRSKKELSALDEEFVERKLTDFFSGISHHQDKDKALAKLSSSKSYKQFMKSREHDFLIKSVRAELRKVYGAFILEEYARKEKILKKLQGADDMQTHLELLRLHKSTKERLSHYEQLYDEIFSKLDARAKKDRYVVLDFACGLNPISNIFFRDRLEKYYASDISSQDCKFLAEYFAKTDVPHEVFPMDIADEKNYAALSKVRCDVCFIFKALDGIERVNRDVTERLLKAIGTRYLAITFPTLSLGGVREIKEFRRQWLERLLDRLGWKWEKKEIENELLYLVEKK